MKDTCHFTFVQTHRLYDTKSDPKCQLWTLDEDDVSIIETINAHTLIHVYVYSFHLVKRFIIGEMYHLGSDVGDWACGRYLREKLGNLCTFLLILL